MTLQSSGGTRGTVEAARREIARFIEQAAAEQRTEAPASKIVLGLNCGGSDSFSGITANPALGHCSDLLAEIGATAVLAETPEIFGAEHLLVRRARNRQVAEKLLDCINDYKQYLNRFEGSFDDNPSPGNKAGGLSNILEKSLGAVAKGGTSPLIEVYDYAERITAPGFVFMNTPGYDPVSLTGLAAGGCNLIAFTTGRGSAIGFPTIPVIKIATNSDTYRRMTDNMDVNAGAIADGEKTVAGRSAARSSTCCSKSPPAAAPAPNARPQGIRALAHRPRDVAPVQYNSESMSKSLFLCRWRQLCFSPLAGSSQSVPKKSAFDKATLEAYVRHLFVMDQRVTVTGARPQAVLRASRLPGSRRPHDHAGNQRRT